MSRPVALASSRRANKTNCSTYSPNSFLGHGLLLLALVLVVLLVENLGHLARIVVLGPLFLDLHGPLDLECARRLSKS